ncbi:15237_t:CDS:2, partial [Racocetra persica]
MSQNIHNHPLSLPSKIPVAIQNNLRDIIIEEDILDLIAWKLITRISMQQFFKGVLLPELYLSLNNRSKIEHIIATKHRAEHPYGQDIIANTYQKLFEEFFTHIEQDYGYFVEFQHIHSRRIRYILADEHYCQALDWVQNKKHLWVLARLSSAFTKMAQNIWTNILFTTNARESAYANINRNERNLFLLAAIT